MKVGLEFTDGGTSIFRELSTVNLGLVKQGLSVASSQLAKEYVRIIKAEKPSDWSSFNDNGKRRLTLKEKKAVFGTKHSRATGEIIESLEPWQHGNIADHVKFFTPPEIHKLYAVVGGGHKTFYPIIWENGIAVGYKKRVTATTRATLDILDGLNDGKVITLSDKTRKFMAETAGYRSSDGTFPAIVHIKPRHFAEQARASGGALALAKVKEIYERTFPKAVANIKVTEKKVKVS